MSSCTPRGNIVAKMQEQNFDICSNMSDSSSEEEFSSNVSGIEEHESGSDDDNESIMIPIENNIFEGMNEQFLNEMAELDTNEHQNRTKENLHNRDDRTMNPDGTHALDETQFLFKSKLQIPLCV